MLIIVIIIIVISITYANWKHYKLCFMLVPSGIR